MGHYCFGGFERQEVHYMVDLDEGLFKFLVYFTHNVNNVKRD